jgi:hypothetical protein
MPSNSTKSGATANNGSGRRRRRRRRRRRNKNKERDQPQGNKNQEEMCVTTTSTVSTSDIGQPDQQHKSDPRLQFATKHRSKMQHRSTPTRTYKYHEMEP